MASGGESTPQKKNESIHIGTCCRLCKSTDKIPFKNLFDEANRSLLITAEDILGKSLEKGELPHLLCRPCERKLDDFRSFKATIKEAQSSFERVKRSVEVSPPVRRPTSKSSTDSEKSCSYRRSLCFDSSSMEKNELPQPLPVSAIDTQGFPSENQNELPQPLPVSAISTQGFPSENQNELPQPLPVSAINTQGFPSENQNESPQPLPVSAIDAQGFPSENQNELPQPLPVSAIDTQGFPSENQNELPQPLPVSAIDAQGFPSENQRLLSQVDRELLHVARQESNSVLRERGCDGMSKTIFARIVCEMETLCPTVFSILSQMIGPNDCPDEKKPVLGLIYGIILFSRCKEMNLIQCVITELLSKGGANQELVDLPHTYGFSLSKPMNCTIPEEIGMHFLDPVAQLLKEDKKFVFVLDNIDWDKNHYGVATSIVFDRISCPRLPIDGRPKQLSDYDLMEVIALSAGEIECTRDRYRILIARILYESFPAFDFLNDVLADHTDCQYRKEMSSQSVVFPLPVLIMKDEKSYLGSADVLDQLEVWVREIYAKAGRCDPLNKDDIHPGPPIRPPSRPDQPASHVPPVPTVDDPLTNVTIPCFGDQLTRVRLAGVKDLRAGSHTAKDRLDHLYPFRIADWHTKKSFLKLVFKSLNANSKGEQGTLQYFQDKLQFRNVSQDVKHYEDCEQFFMSVGKCFAIEALLEFFEMENTNGKILKNRSLYHLLDEGDTKKKYFHSVLDKFIDEFFLLPHIVPSPDYEHLVRNYPLWLLRYYFILLDYKDAVEEGNGERLATLHKVLLPYFKSFGQDFKNYSIEMLISVVQNEIFLSNAEAFQCKWASTANWKGGSRKNIEIDLMQENLNDIIKSNKTVSATEWSSRSSGGERQIVVNVDQQMNSVPPSSSHSLRSSITDEVKIMTDLRKLRPFKYDPISFPDIAAKPLPTLDQEGLQDWLTKHKKNLMRR